jgi:glycosyltransferase involved in cell wall biosynthesis
MTSIQIKTLLKADVIYITAIGVSARCFLTSHFTELRKHGTNCFLSCTYDEDAKFLEENLKLPILPVTISTEINPWLDFIALIKMIVIFLRYRPKVVHAHMSKAGFIGMIASFVTFRKNRIYHNHGMAYFSATGLKKLILWVIETVNCSLATEVIFCSKSTLDEACRVGFVNSHKAKVLGEGTISGVDIDNFSTARKVELKDQTKRSFGFADSTLIVGFVARLVPHKGVQTLLEAWDILVQQKLISSEISLVIVGSESHEQTVSSVKEYVVKHSSIHYLGYQSEMIKIYSMFDMVVLPSWYEGFPYSLLEAQSMGIPVIATRVAGNIDAVIDNHTGLLCEVHSAVSLAKCIEKLIINDKVRNQYGTNARERVVKYFSQKVVMNNLIDFYRTLIKF